MPIMVRYNAKRMAKDITRKGWQPVDLAREAGVAPSTVGRFLNGESQTARTAAKLADALGYDLDRYIKAVA